MKKTKLTLTLIKKEAADFSKSESKHSEPSMYGITDGKAVGTYLEHKFQTILESKYNFTPGSSAKGMDFPSLNIDMKVTSIVQPQSSCPFKSARQKIYGIGYSILLFVYDKKDNEVNKTSNLDIQHTVFIKANKTADYQMTSMIRNALENDGNEDDIISIMSDRNLPVDDITAISLAEEILKNKPEQGYLTISNALQWRLQYSRVVEEAGRISGIIKLG